jgi:hypothetical protein
LKPIAEFSLALHNRAGGLFVKDLTEGIHMSGGYMTAPRVELFEVQRL